LMWQSDRPQTGLDLVDSMLIDSLDLVIAACTSVAHLAAALGKPTWIVLDTIDTIDTNAHWGLATGAHGQSFVSDGHAVSAKGIRRRSR